MWPSASLLGTKTLHLADCHIIHIIRNTQDSEEEEEELEDEEEEGSDDVSSSSSSSYAVLVKCD
eukprot:scaffold111374_cov76-Cyclotella_meneghiniana.AAC.3